MSVAVGRLWLRLVLLALLFGSFGACAGVPNEPILYFPNKKECNPKEQVDPLLFAKGVEYGCLTLSNTGKEDQYFPIQISKDGSYAIQDPNTGEYTKEKLGATVAPGVKQVNVDIYFLKEDLAKLNKDYCATLAKEKMPGCWKNPKCLFIWRGEKLSLDPKEETGTCRICQQEKCNGKDDNCDGVIDDNNVCGSILTYRCEYNKDIPSACTAAGPCRCIVTPVGKQVCYHATNPMDQKWNLVSDIKSQCSAGKTFYCNSDTVNCSDLP